MIIRFRLRDGQTITFSYDALGRLTYRNIPTPVAGETDVAYYYANHGQPTSIQTRLSTFVNRNFDALGRMTHETTQTGQRGLQYDNTTWPGG